MEAYWASKALARSSVHDFMRTHNPHFDYVALLPSVVIGPDPRASSVEELLEGTKGMVLGPVLGDVKPFPMVGVPVHVADVAKAHVAALAVKVKGNAEYILSSDGPEGVQWDDSLDIARRYFAEECGYGSRFVFPNYSYPLLDIMFFVLS